MHTLSLSAALVALLSAVATAVPTQDALPLPTDGVGKYPITPPAPTTTSTTTSTTPATTTTTTQSPAYSNFLLDPGFEDHNEPYGVFRWWRPWEARDFGPNPLVKFSTHDSRSARTGWRGMSIEFPKNNTQATVTQGFYQDWKYLLKGRNYRFVGVGSKLQWVRPNVPYPPCSLHIFMGNGQLTVREHLVWRPAGSIPGTGWAVDSKNFTLDGNYAPLYFNLRVQCNTYRTQDIRFDFDDFELFEI
ncbi:hypothetical protein V8F20_005183 [Naviculisporaceae sp. PSN 640]